MVQNASRWPQPFEWHPCTTATVSPLIVVAVDSFLGVGEKISGPLPVSPALFFSSLPSSVQFRDEPVKRTSERTFTQITLLGKTNIDTDETANNDGRLFLLLCSRVRSVVFFAFGVGRRGSRLWSWEVGVKSQLDRTGTPLGPERSR